MINGENEGNINILPVKKEISTQQENKNKTTKTKTTEYSIKI